MLFTTLSALWTLIPEDPIKSISQECSDANIALYKCLSKYSSNKYDKYKCTQCASKYTTFKSKCKTELKAFNLNLIASDMSCHQEKGVYCNRQVNETKGVFNCKNPCHKYAANYILNEEFSTGFEYSKTSKAVGINTDLWLLDDMVSCINTGCVKSTWNFYICLTSQNPNGQSAGSPPSPFTPGIQNTCGSCDTDFYANCKLPSTFEMANSLDRACKTPLK
eukprot:NODE_784_length_3906_cov_0.645390.p2 type:complete len:221 gc:universal NODE_784_length_3906_cov_0.645390:2937-2275(-)